MKLSISKKKLNGEVIKLEDKDLYLQQLDYIQQLEKLNDQLSTRISVEGEHRIRGFKNRIAGALQPTLASLEEVSNEEMTIDLGKALWNELKQVMKILKSLGVPIKVNF